MKFLTGFIVYAITLGSFALAAGTGWFYHQLHKAGPREQAVLINIAPGSSVSAIARNLQAHNLIAGEYAPLVFKIAAKLEGTGYALKAGEYEIPSRSSMTAIMAQLHEGKSYQRFVTIPEGLTSFEIMRLLKTAENLSGILTDIPAEGSLLPDSYSHSRGESRTAIVKRMRKAMNDLRTKLDISLSVKILCALKEETDISDACWHKIITLASIVEKETGKPEERRAVAGVFLNRLRIGMALQTDPTVIYAITKGKHKNGGKGPLGRRLLKKDLEFDSPYNTYKYPGLPPGPIANPGRASIEAVFQPEEHKYIYFVADGTGGHVFARTLKEHNNNVARWRKIRRKNGN